MTLKELYNCNKNWKPRTTLIVHFVDDQKHIETRQIEMFAFPARLVYAGYEVVFFEDNHIFLYEHCCP